MKKRQGFVSNSSSSSFVILGFKTNLTEEQNEKISELKENVSTIFLGDVYVPNSRNNKEYIFGASIGIGELENKEYDYKTLMETLSNGCQKAGLTMPNDIKIFTGTMQC